MRKKVVGGGGVVNDRGGRRSWVGTEDSKVPRTRRQECLRYEALLREGLGVEFFGSFGEIFEERGAEPAFDSELWRVVPVAAVLFAGPLEFRGVAGKRCGREDETKTVRGIGNIFGEAVDHHVDAGDERLTKKADFRIVEDPHAFIFIWWDDEKAVHWKCFRSMVNM